MCDQVEKGALAIYTGILCLINPAQCINMNLHETLNIK